MTNLETRNRPAEVSVTSVLHSPRIKGLSVSFCKEDIRSQKLTKNNTAVNKATLVQEVVIMSVIRELFPRTSSKNAANS